MVAYGDYILNEIRAARELNRWIDGEDLRAYVTDFFQLYYPGCAFRQVEHGSAEYEIKLSNDAKLQIEQFIREKRLTATRLTQNLTQPALYRFENRTIAETRYRTELITQFHPLVRFVSASIEKSNVQLRPAVGVCLPLGACGECFRTGIHVLAVARWSLDGLHAVEKLAFATARLDSAPGELNSVEAERLAAACARHGSDWFEARTTVDFDAAVRIADHDLFGALEKQFEEYVEDVRRQNEDRADLQLKTLDRHLTKKRHQMVATRDQHESLGRSSLVKATEGRIHALENRIAQRRLKIENDRAIRYRNDEVLLALVNVV